MNLFVLTADADALAVIRAVLDRPRSLKIDRISFEVDRHTGRDSGMVRDGPELIRMRVQKTLFERVLLIWDHAGSGRERVQPQKAQADIRSRLAQVTWEGRSDAIVVVPEIEEWLWHSAPSIARHLGISVEELGRWAGSFAAQRNADFARCKRCWPKELFQHVFYQRYKRRPLPSDFEGIASTASLIDWQNSDSFAELTKTLRNWYPPA